jgi:mannose-6-phosphate isomerase-like protein (cupin superfamily)
MDQPLFFPNWRNTIVFSAGGPQPQVLHEDSAVKVVVVGLEPGGQIPVHPGAAGVYHFLEGEGQMRVGEDAFDVQAGGTVVVPAGAARGMTARTRLAFIAVRIA